MLLSEAIRLGAVIRPQARGGFFKNGGSCALGAAGEAIGLEHFVRAECLKGDKLWQAWDLLAEHFPILSERFSLDNGNSELMEWIWRWNDCEGHSREEIANRVATIEAQQAQPQLAAQEMEAVR